MSSLVRRQLARLTPRRVARKVDKEVRKVNKEVRKKVAEYEENRPKNREEGIIRRGGYSMDEVLVVTDAKFGTQIIRKATTDWPTYQQVFNQEDYAFAHWPIRTILDLGANVGYSAVYYHSRFPTASIIAVEPSTDNVLAAQVNVQLAHAEHAITVVPSAIWHSGSRLRITNPKANAWAFRVAEAEPGDPTSFVARTVPDLMRQFGWASIDLVKIDIEAAERFLFSQNTEWLASVKEIVIELHDRFTPGCRAPVEEALDRHFGPYEEITKGENTLFRRVAEPARVKANGQRPVAPNVSRRSTGS